MRDKRAKSFEDLLVWRRSHDLVLLIYRVSADFPQSEVYGLTAQLRRAACSVPANIVEGFRRQGKADKLRFYNIAQASLEEARYFMMLARDLGYCSDDGSQARFAEVAFLLERYMKATAEA